MIFVTVGTTRFDELVEAIDRIAHCLDEEIIIQAGNHKYVPKNCQFFTFANDILNYLKKANIVIAHGGAGITFEALDLHKKIISIINPNVLDSHQSDLLRKLSQEGHLIWCNDLNKLNIYIKGVTKEVC